MNFLQLAQRVRQLAGISGNGPTSVIDQTGEMLRVVNWTAEAWRKVQLSRGSWRWMRDSATATTVAGTNRYPPSGPLPSFGLTRWGRWIVTSFYVLDQDSGQYSELFYMPYADFRRSFLFYQQAPGRPLYVSEAPNGDIMVAPVPDKQYVLIGDYYRSVQDLVANEDTPEMPADYHMAIVYRALMMYAAYEAAAEVYADAQNNFVEEMSRLEGDQLENVTIYNETLVE